ncbi:MAG: hypothetical protein JSS22_20160 [Proteobacteria bacterium]|nr:hypothetical protein [Pseudomonadota bacterium]
MSKPESEQGYDHSRYQKLLADATDEAKRLALIDLLIEEGARDKLMRERISRLGLTRPPERLYNQSSVSSPQLPSTNERGEIG